MDKLFSSGWDHIPLIIHGGSHRFCHDSCRCLRPSGMKPERLICYYSWPYGIFLGLPCLLNAVALRGSLVPVKKYKIIKKSSIRLNAICVNHNAHYILYINLSQYLHQSYLNGQKPSPHCPNNPPSVLHQSASAKFLVTSALHWSLHLQPFRVVVSVSAFPLGGVPKHILAKPVASTWGVDAPKGHALFYNMKHL